MSGRVAIRKRRQNRLGMLLVTVVVLMLLLVVAVKCMELKQKQEIYLTREAQLQEQIDEQEARADEIEEFRKYTKTKKYAEEVAKDKLGLVNEDEIIFKEE
ncbi:MAG: septum formation initiator family protein [Lachnospiraceae bacterium]|nr:septum formation initiator family protein [Lachnospiraceae bacterium]MDD3659421.1 septum formation initiator family protein [Lachnospiraceae bacterium]